MRGWFTTHVVDCLTKHLLDHQIVFYAKLKEEESVEIVKGCGTSAASGRQIVFSCRKLWHGGQALDMQQQGMQHKCALGRPTKSKPLQKDQWSVSICL